MQEQRRKYNGIIGNFISSKKLFQIIDLDDEDSSNTKDQVNLYLSSKGLQKKIITLDINDSIHLINKERARLSSLHRSSYIRGRTWPRLSIAPRPELIEEADKDIDKSVGDHESTGERLYSSWNKTRGRNP